MTTEIKKAEKDELTVTEAKQELADFKTATRGYAVGRAIYYRACWRVHTLKLYKYFKTNSEKDFLEQLGVDKIGQTTFREACRVYKQFLDRVKTLPEFKGGDDDDSAAKEYTEKLIEKTYAAVGSNGSFLGELARTKMVGKTKRETEENLEDVKTLYFDEKEKTKTFKDFAKAVKKKFGLANPEASERRVESEAARAAGRAAKATKPDGDTFMVNMRFPAISTARIVSIFEGVSTSTGMRHKYAEMSSDEIGSNFMTMATRLDKGLEIPRDAEGRKRYAVDRARELTMALTGVKFPDDALNDVIGEFNGIVKPLAEKL